MRMILAVLDAPAHVPPSQIEAQVAADVLWAATRPEDLIEHIYVRAVHHRLYLVFYHRAPEPDIAARTVVCLCQRAGRASPLLRGWAVHLLEP
jgi:hypothetical protein